MIKKVLVTFTRGPVPEGGGADALIQAAKFIAVGLVLWALVLGMAAELAIFKCLASVEI